MEARVMGAITPAKRDQPIFYVYEYWRPDTGECFWVGKGHGDRAHRFRKRNFHFDNVVAKLRRDGLDYEIRIVRKGLTEAEALALEVWAIARWRAVGAPLTNITDGGEGVTGHKHSEATRAKLSVARKGKIMGPHSEETRRKIGLSHIGKCTGPHPEHSARLKGRKHTAEHCAAISAGLTGREVSPETRAKLSVSNTGQERSPETCEKLRISHLGKKQSPELIEKRIAPLRGKKRDPAIGAKCSATQKGRPKNPESVAKMKANHRSPEYLAKVSGDNHWSRRRLKSQS
jgi:NUMOD3 motif